VDPSLLPAHKQAAMVAARELSAVELLNTIVERYERLNPALNAVVVERVELARAQAQTADEQVAAGRELGRFHGVPVTIKEVMDWVGTPSTWGDTRHANYLPTRNAVVVDRLLDQGAIIWGKTNVPLDLGQWQSFNDVYGRTNSPWDLERTPGGSSGGSAASLAVGFAGLEVGSDIGGSIRFPAHYCGVLGHKPSFATVPAAGHTYPGQAADVDINVVGPMARSARDLADAMELFSDRILVPETRTDLADFTVGVMFQNPLGGAQDDEMTGVLADASKTLIDAGLRIAPQPLEINHERAQQNYLLLNYAATSLVTASPDEAARITHPIWLQLSNERERIRELWAQYFSRVDLLLCPVAASPAPPHQTDLPFADQTIPVNGQIVSSQEQWIWAGMASGAYLPATVAPVGQTAAGLPVGIQIIAPFAHDLRSIRFAELIERELGGFVPPPMLAS